MSVPTIQDPGQVFEIIESGNTVIIHYWPPWHGPQSPLQPMFEGVADGAGGALQFYIVDSGFVHPEFSPDEMPLTVLYKDGEKVDTAPFDQNATFDLIRKAESL